MAGTVEDLDREEVVTGFRPEYTRAEAESPLPMWPITGMITLMPLWFILGLAGFSWVVFALPMLASLVRRRNIVVPKGSGWWVMFLVAAAASVFSIDSVARLSGWMLRYGYYIGATVTLIYVLNGRAGLPSYRVIRAFTWLWMSTVVGGYLAFVVGDLSFLAPAGYVVPAVLRENDLINTLVTPSFADIQDIIGFPVPRPKAPFPYTNSWGSMLGLLTPFGLMALHEPRVGFSKTVVKLMLAASVVPAVISLNRGLWLSLGLGLIYAAFRFGVAGGSRAIRNSIIVVVFLAVSIVATPLNGIVMSRLDNGHSDGDRTELILDALEGASERPVFGWGAPRPNDRNLPSVGTHGQIWFVAFSHGFIGALGYLGTLFSLTWRTRRQPTVTGMWAHVVLIVGIVQLPYYLHVPHQLFTMLAAAALAIRLQNDVV